MQQDLQENEPKAIIFFVPFCSVLHNKILKNTILEPLHVHSHSICLKEQKPKIKQLLSAITAQPL